MKTQTDKLDQTTKVKPAPQTDRYWERDYGTASVTSDSPNITTRQALRVLGPFAKQGGFYFRVVWPTCSRVLHSKSFRTANRWSSIIQRRIAEASAI